MAEVSFDTIEFYYSVQNLFATEETAPADNTLAQATESPTNLSTTVTILEDSNQDQVSTSPVITVGSSEIDINDIVSPIVSSSPTVISHSTPTPATATGPSVATQPTIASKSQSATVSTTQHQVATSPVITAVEDISPADGIGESVAGQPTIISTSITVPDICIGPAESPGPPQSITVLPDSTNSGSAATVPTITSQSRASPADCEQAIVTREIPSFGGNTTNIEIEIDL